MVPRSATEQPNIPTWSSDHESGQTRLRLILRCVATSDGIPNEVGTHRRTKALCVEDVFDTDWNAVKNAAELLAARLSLALSSVRQDGVAVEGHPCPNLRLDFIYARKQSFHIIDGR